MAAPELTIDDVADYEADALVRASRSNADFIRQRIQAEEERLDRIELFIFRRVGFLHQSAKEAS